MTVLKLRKRQITILELAGFTAWIAICLSIFPFSILLGRALVLWTISFLVTWFITDSKWSIFQALFAGTFCVLQSVLIGLAALILFSAFFDYLPPFAPGLLLTPILIVGAVIGGIVGAYLHFSVVRNRDD